MNNLNYLLALRAVREGSYMGIDITSWLTEAGVHAYETI